MHLCLGRREHVCVCTYVYLTVHIYYSTCTDTYMHASMHAYIHHTYIHTHRDMHACVNVERVGCDEGVLSARVLRILGRRVGNE